MMILIQADSTKAKDTFMYRKDFISLDCAKVTARGPIYPQLDI